MRCQDRGGVKAVLQAVVGAATAGVLVLAAAAALSQEVSQGSPRLIGPTPAMENEPVPQLAHPITNDRRVMRNYPEQPPVIPHSIEGYQLSLNANRCLECHRRQFTESSGAPMISATHFMDRDFQVLADVAPRRYFCLQCHVPQTDAEPLVANDFVDMSKIGSE